MALPLMGRFQRTLKLHSSFHVGSFQCIRQIFCGTLELLCQLVVLCNDLALPNKYKQFQFKNRDNVHKLILILKNVSEPITLHLLQLQILLQKTPKKTLET